MERKKLNNRITIRIDDQDLKFLQELAERNNMKLGKVVRNAIKSFISDLNYLFKE